MQINKALLISLVVLILALSRPLFSQQVDPIQLVESVPAETKLGIPETARTLPVWLNLIGSADRTIDMEVFYISNKQGEALVQVIDALKTAASRGVVIRIIADAKMAGTYPETLEELNRLPNISVRRISYFDKLGGVMHAKYFVVDSKELFVGSQNMDWRALQHIHELGVRISNEKLAKLTERIFNLDWEIAAGEEQLLPAELPPIPPELRIDANNPLRLPVASGQEIVFYPTFSPQQAIFPGMEWDQTQIVKLMNEAKKRIEFQLLSYSPVSHREFFAALDNAIRGAAARGVRVRMILSNWNTRQPGIQYLKSLQVVPNIEVRISTIPPYSGGFIPYGRVEHCKYMVVDDTLAWIGTSNWSYSYFHTSRNLGLVFESGYINSLVHKIFMKGWDSGYAAPLDLCKEYVPPDVGGSEGK